MLTKAWCHRHKRICKLVATETHGCGHPCIDDSSVGKKAGANGRSRKLFYMWIAIVRTLRLKIVTNENVRGFGQKEFRELLQDLYFITGTSQDARNFGWKTKRDRQILLAILKVWGKPVLADYDRAKSSAGARDSLAVCGDFEELMEQVVDLDAAIALFHRKAVYSCFDYLEECTEESLVKEKVWASGRNAVRSRYGMSSQISMDSFSDDKSTHLGALTHAERHRWEIWNKKKNQKLPSTLVMNLRFASFVHPAIQICLH